MKHFLSVQDMTATEIIDLLDMAESFRKEEVQITKQVFAANLFLSRAHERKRVLL